MGLGLPKISIEFKTKGVTAIERSARGIVALIIRDDTEGTFDETIYESVADIDFTKISKRNHEYLKLLYLGSPSKVIVINLKDKQVNDALKKLAPLKFNYLVMPAATAEEVLTLSAWIKEQREESKKTFKAVLPNSKSDHEGIINFTPTNILSEISKTVFSTAEYCARIAGVLAGLSLARSSTYYVLTDIISMDEVLDADDRIGKGELTIIFDGENHKIARGVNSFISHTTEKGKDFSKIKIVEGIDLYQDDIRDTFEKYYIGKYRNDYDNKQAFVGAINAYNKSLEGDVLDKSHNNFSEIDIEAQRMYLEKQGISTKKMKDIELKTTNTGSTVFVKGNIKFVDAMEDLVMINHL